MKAFLLILVAAVALMSVWAQSIDVLDEPVEIELDAGEKRKAEETAIRSIPPKVMGYWNFDNVPADCKHLPCGWWAGIWGDRKAYYGTEEGYGGKGRSMLVDIHAISGGEVQIFSPGWALVKGGWYKISFKIRGWDHPGSVGFQVREAAGSWRSPLGGITVHPTDEWKEYSFGGRSGCSMKPGQFGIMIGAGTPGCFAIDDVKVEMYQYNPFPPPRPQDAVPFTPGNLIPRGSFESAEDAFWCTEFITADPHETYDEPMISRVVDGESGRHCLRHGGRIIPETGKMSGAGSRILSIPIPVATSRIYRVSARVKTSAQQARVSLNVKSGESVLGGASEVIGKGAGWVEIGAKLRRFNAYQREVTVSIENGTGDEIFIDSLYFGEAVGKVNQFFPAAPYELDLGFVRDDPVEPRAVSWGEKLPLSVAVWPAVGAPKGERFTAKLRVTAFPERVTCEEKVELVVGTPKRIDLDPKANGVLRVELLSEDPKLAKPLELQMARLPKPRGLGEKGRFGMHMRVSPQILAHARRIGLTWQRIHDCSPITNMGWGNGVSNRYIWADREVDAMRRYGISILGMPDYVPGWMKKKVLVENAGFKAAKAKREKEISLDGGPTTGISADGDEEILESFEKMLQARDKHLNSHEEIHYDDAAFSNWCEKVAAHYKGRIDHWAIWNEPYMLYFYDGSDFGKTFYHGLKGIRAGNPQAKVLGWCNEITTPYWCSGFIRKYPVKDKPDHNSTHYYYMGIPGDGDFGVERLVGEFAKTFGEYKGDEIWNTEGNLGMMPSFYSYRTSADAASTAAAFGVRGWGESFYSGIARVFLFGMFNCDGCGRNGGLLCCSDYDRSINVWGAATATTAYFIDAMEPVTTVPSPKGVKLRIFKDDQRTSSYLFDDCLVRGRPRFDAAKLPAKYVATDAMGTPLADLGIVELNRVPIFVACDGEAPEALAAAIEKAIVR